MTRTLPEGPIEYKKYIIVPFSDRCVIYSPTNRPVATRSTKNEAMDWIDLEVYSNEAIDFMDEQAKRTKGL